MMTDPAKAADFIRRIQIGVTWGRRAPTIEHLFGTYHIVHSSGGSYLSGQTREYGRASHELVDLTHDDGGIGYRTYQKCRVNQDYHKEGRFLKADREAWLNEVKRFMG